MHKLYELLVPSWAEALLYMAVALVLLLILNASDLWNALLNSAGTDSATATSIDRSLHSFVATATRLSDPQLVNAFVWGATAALGVFTAVAIAGFLRGTRDSATDLRTRRGEVTFAERMVVRLAALGGAIIATLFAVFVLLPVLSYVFETRLSTVAENWQNAPVALLAWFGVALSGYIVAVLCRLVALKVRVFSAVVN